MTNSSVWITKRKGKKGVRYIVRWIEPYTCKNRGKTFKRLEDARDYQSRIRYDLKSEDYRLPVKISYDEWINWHLDDLEHSPDTDLAPKTIAGHKEALLALAEVCKPKTPLEITPKMIRVFRKIQLEKGYAARTINKHISAIRSALSYAVRAEIIPVNKLRGPHRLMLREERKPVRIVDVNEVAQLLEITTDLRYKAAISLGYYHGLRRREISNLMWDDIDLNDFWLEVKDRPKAHTKTRKSRKMALRKETGELLKKLYIERNNEYVFKEPGTFYWSFDKWFPKMVKKAKLKHFSIHDLRKTCNTLMKEKGVSAEAVMQILGHCTFEVNQRHYTGILTEQQRRAIDSIPSVG